MTLKPGVRLGPYEVLDLIGAGGMGEVYRARDTRLDRTVAHQGPPRRLAGDAARARPLRARGPRDLRPRASPHLHALRRGRAGRPGLPRHGAPGRARRSPQRLPKGPLPLAQALELAVADRRGPCRGARAGDRPPRPQARQRHADEDGREAARLRPREASHHGGQPAGRASRPTPTESAPAHRTRARSSARCPTWRPSSWRASPRTRARTCGRSGRSCYEMVTGRRAFEGTSQASLIAAIMEREPPPLATLQPLTPPALERLVLRCLAKRPDDRWDSAHDLAASCAGSPRRPASAPVRGRQSSRHRRRRGSRARSRSSSRAPSSPASPAGDGWRPPCPGRTSSAPSWTSTGGGAERRGDRAPGSRLPAGHARPSRGRPTAGRSCSWAGAGGVQQLYVRALDAREARALDGTEEAQAPAVSPDGQWVAFWAGGAIAGSRSRVDRSASSSRRAGWPPPGMAWGEDGRLFYDGEDRALWWAQPERSAHPLTTRLDTEARAPAARISCPAARARLFTVCQRGWTSGDEEVFALVIATGERRRLLKAPPTPATLPRDISCSCARAPSSPCRSIPPAWRSGARRRPC